MPEGQVLEAPHCRNLPAPHPERDASEKTIARRSGKRKTGNDGKFSQSDP
jgi:hypothetical protein